MAIRVVFEASDKMLLEAFRRQGPVIIERLSRQLTISMIELQSHIVLEKMQGQVLHHRTGKAAASVRVEGVTASGNELKGSVIGGGGPAWYLAVHEFGGTREYTILPVNKKALAFFPGESIGGAIGRMGPIGVGKGTLRSLYKGGSLRSGKVGQFSMMGGVVVKKVIHPPLPARPVMRTGLEEMRAKIVNDLRKAIMGGW